MALHTEQFMEMTICVCEICWCSAKFQVQAWILSTYRFQKSSLARSGQNQSRRLKHQSKFSSENWASKVWFSLIECLYTAFQIFSWFARLYLSVFCLHILISTTNHSYQLSSNWQPKSHRIRRHRLFSLAQEAQAKSLFGVSRCIEQGTPVGRKFCYQLRLNL